jgi:WD repeat-containing protein 55
MIRVLQVYPNKLLGVIGDHGEFPIERMEISRDGRWLGSASHDESLKMTDIKDCLEDSDDDDEKIDKKAGKTRMGSVDSDQVEGEGNKTEESEDDSSEEEEVTKEKKRKKKRRGDPLGIKKKKENLRGTGDPSFFADL